MTEPARNAPLTAEDVKLLVRGDWLQIWSDDPWFGGKDPPDQMPINKLAVRFTGNVSNSFPMVGPHLEVMDASSVVYPGKGWVHSLFRFLARPADPNDPEGWVESQGSDPMPGLKIPIEVRRDGVTWQVMSAAFNWELWVVWRPHTPAPAGASGTVTVVATHLGTDGRLYEAPTPASNGDEGAATWDREICTGCSSSISMDEIKARGIVSCCPDRRMVKVWDLVRAYEALSAHQEREARAREALERVDAEARKIAAMLDAGYTIQAGTFAETIYGITTPALQSLKETK